MKILAIDDQQLILLSVEKRLTELGYEVRTATSIETGIKLFNSFKPDLVLLDMNMPEMSGTELVLCTGTEVVKYIRVFMNNDTPILVMSGNTDEALIMRNFDLGVDDYMKKPVSLDEMAARIKRIIGAPETKGETKRKLSDTRMLQKNCVGVVIPCYNEEERLLSDQFKEFAHKNLGYHLCFVNDGSTDNTLAVLEKLKEENRQNISIYNCKQNGGKAEAVRQGILHLVKDQQLDYIGFLDADLSTDFRNFDDLVKTIESLDFKIVSGSRITRMGADITKESARKIISLTINLIIQTILGMPFKDTQCGAKVMDREIASKMFNKKFVTKWLFDVELFMRMKKYFGKTEVKSMICEQPLKRWIHADGSKLSMKDSIKIMGQLAQIAVFYR
ncbi:DNA-binding response regulator, OmpR family, contains REC and winged-helix (wHTH) domain [Maribacter orientalis]|uniref:dolichyl-phosphate beta-glucosyltransferase n=1 Tax=Maribacter orientalis TaxID=228957 RepID=A0A1H7PUX1_9FLAO|nr:response regulator [Maribacter orientalis]SEL38847.1 DNA-binding response regulator, OmpR family, contains REC and winged-helix (wHTH) domain [Maribacter orientalis]|tara:strand:- start:296 stop:1462 length:1167 start_codon:yes stop_codon:yes gene_type:complete